jgi:cell division inhibitor SepF
MSIKSIFNKFLYDEGEEQEFNGAYPEVDEAGYDYAGEPEIDLGASEPKSTSGTSISSGSSIEMVVVKPEKLETVTQIADYLVDRKTILLNLEETNKETARRLIDFLNGVAYAINGDLRKVATNTYVVTPSNVELSGEKLSSTQEAAFTKE